MYWERWVPSPLVKSTFDVDLVAWHLLVRVLPILAVVAERPVGATACENKASIPEKLGN